MLTREYDINIEVTKDRYSIVKINKNKKNVYIGSKYNMNMEINKFVEKARKTKKDIENVVFILYGFSVGDHIKRLRKEFPCNEIIVFEPNKKLYKYILENYTWIGKDEKLNIISCDEEDLNYEVKKYIDEIKMSYMEIIEFSNYATIYEEEYKNFIREFKAAIIDIVLNRNTALMTSKRWFETLLSNLKYIAYGIPIDEYNDYYKDKPAVIVSAGPSLDKNIDELKKIDDEMVIIGGGRTLKSLMNKDIKTHLLVSIDAYDIQYNGAKGYVENYNGPLLFYEGTNEKVVSNHPGDKIFYTNLDCIRDMAERPIKPLFQGGSVAHIMTDYAILAGCNPIIFIGQDLAYTNDTTYSKVADEEDGSRSFEKVKNDNDDIYVEDVNGGKVRTSLSFDKFRRTFEQIIIQHPDIKFINATEGGARIKGSIEMPLKEAIKLYAKEKLPDIVRVKYEVDLKRKSIELLEKCEKSGESIIKKCEKSLDLLSELKKSYIIKDYSKVNGILKKMDKIDEEIRDSYKDVEVIGSLIYPIIYTTLTSKKVVTDKPNLEETDKIINQNNKFYSQIKETLEEALEKISKLTIEMKKEKGKKA